MIIAKKRLRTLPSQLKRLPSGTQVVVAVQVFPDDLKLLRRVGFTDKPEIGDAVLPSKVGPRTHFNAEGGEIVHRDQPMETAYQTIEWSWQEFHGPYDTVERTDFRDRPYKRYPRTKIPAPAVELTMSVLANGQRAIVSPEIAIAPPTQPELLERINLFLEIFGRCELFSENLAQIVQAPLRRLNWEVLRSGQWTWDKLRKRLERVLDREEKGNRSVIEARFEYLNSCKPDFIAVGTAGFAGYVVFAFAKYSYYILESIYPDNATYVFRNDWETLSQMTKAQIIENNLAVRRIVHRKTWWTQMRSFVHGMRKSGK